MRVIAGKARRINLKTAEGTGTRPTTDRIKETLFNILQPELPGARVLDLFSGSGALGIEALSRGAEYCVMAEKDPRALACIRSNLDATRLAGSARVMGTDVFAAIRRLSGEEAAFDLILMDPPYGKGLETEALRALAGSGLVGDSSLIVIETALDNELEGAGELGYTVVRVKNYKTNRHFFLRKTQSGPVGQE